MAAEIGRMRRIPLRPVLLCALLTTFSAGAATKAGHKTWTEPEVARREDADFAIQGEYRSADAGPAAGAQVVALGDGKFDFYVLDGKENECGGIYSIAKPRVNMCLPPLAWQTYDVAFTAARFDAEGKRTAWPRITVRLNGVVVHENLELAKDFTTAAPIAKPLTGPTGPVFLQDHGNPVVFRNIWIVPGR